MEKQKALEILYVEINRELHVASHRFSVAERRDKLGPAEILERGVAEAKKRWLLAQQFQILQIARRVDFKFQLGGTIYRHRRAFIARIVKAVQLLVRFVKVLWSDEIAFF